MRVTGTSFLMPNSQGWAVLAARHPLDFGTYGDWPAALSGAAAEPVIWVVCAEDVDLTALDLLLMPLRQRLTGSTQPVLVAWSAGASESPIRMARHPTAGAQAARALETALYDLAATNPALHLLPLDQIFADAGRAACFDARNWYLAHCRLSLLGIRLLAEAAASVLTRYRQAPAKLLVLDCDNTIWGGIIGEAGLAGLMLGQDGLGAAFTDVQRAAKILADQGVLLALASKNDAADVWAVFDQHPGMVLRRSDLAAWRINWRDKADNLADLAAELDLGLDSLVFWDDNPLERESMRQRLPQVITPEPPREVTQWPAALARLDALARFEVTEDDRRKTEQYRHRAAFVEQRRGADDEIGFLRKIGLTPSARPINAASRARAAQLCAKTNQFNLTTRRHGEADLARFDPDLCFLVDLKDRFGDHGTVGLVIARAGAEAGIAVLDSFLLSCRVLGRHLDAWMLDHLAAILRRRGYAWLVGEYRPSGRNGMAADFLSRHGLTALDDLPPDLAARLRAGLPDDGLLFAADLATLSIPYLEAFVSVEAIPA